MCIGLCIRGACCCCQACCNDTCRLLKDRFGLTIRQQVRLAYIGTSFVAIIFAIFLMYIAPASLGFWSVFIHCPEKSGGDMICLGVSAVYRMSATLVSLYLLILLCCLMRDGCARFINENFWCMKLFFIVALFFSLMFVSNDIFKVYAEVSKYMGGLFLLFQIVMMIDIFYLMGERMKVIYDRGYNIMAYGLIGSALAFYSAAIYLNIKTLQWFPCSQAVVIINIVLIVVITILVLTGYFQNGSLVTSGAMSLYLTYQIWNGLNNTKEPECNAFSHSDTFMKVQIGFGVFFILCALLYISLTNYENQGTISERANILDNKNSKDSDEDDRDFLEELSDEEDEEDDNRGANQQNKKKKNNNNNNMSTMNRFNQQQKLTRQQRRLRDYKSNSYIAFHFLMMLCSFYIAMVLTNWGAPVINATTWAEYKPSTTSLIINIGCSYISWVVYIWTLVAPKIFPDRDFGAN